MKADHKKVAHEIHIAQGQLDGILRMIDEDAYCIDVSNQLLATIALLKRVNRQVISAHLSSCVKEAKDCCELDEKIAEIDGILERMSR